MKHFDVLIVGGGLAGGSLALALQATGLNTAVVETLSSRERMQSPAGDRALALARQGVAALLKESSPSCGLRRVHVDDAFVSGKGAWAAALSQRMACFSEREVERFLEVVARSFRGRLARADI